VQGLSEAILGSFQLCEYGDISGVEVHIPEAGIAAETKDAME
jgi:hypothetical protein